MATRHQRNMPVQRPPQNKALKQGNFRRPPAQGRVYAVKQEEAQAPKLVIRSNSKFRRRNFFKGEEL